ncbi:hypothetical protein [Hymenobacter nivis]|uniref:Uncharacterized protein n=1 Tax=Hymenobacter nivis TaxID=1850093 RepID=A0A2Z3GM63_9BACT|nr:hypothetical protein [Hymenobacter nivis]AWM33192.1 hypothetical protein DDQ68_10625 [Hymenobacter nivis]
MAKKAVHATFVRALDKAHTEEDVKNVVAKQFDITYDTADRNDLYTPRVLFEFKFDKNFASLRQRAAVLAQALYYMRRLKFGYTDRPIPGHICLADRNEGLLFDAAALRDVYADEAHAYDWDLAPSSPDPRLTAALLLLPAVRDAHVYDLRQETEYEAWAARLAGALASQAALGLADKKVITERNFEEVYHYWNNQFGESVRNGKKSSRYFMADIQEGRSLAQPGQGRVLFNLGTGAWVDKKILPRAYDYFWSLYEKVTNPDTMRALVAKIDRLSDEESRRREGEFYTPLSFAAKALDYLERTLGPRWWATGQYRLWDMAAGTGNLEYGLPTDALPFCYLSTLDQVDVDHCQGLFPGATIFQYDYLNDDIGNLFNTESLGYLDAWKLPKTLRDDLANPALKWIVLINPPFATSQTAGTAAPGKKSKDLVSATRVQKVMHREGLGETSRELFAQFLFRIRRDFQGKTAHLGMFSKTKYLNATNDHFLRERVFRYEFERGFVFSSANFAGTKGKFPVGFLLWNLGRERALDDQIVELNVFNEQVEKVGTKLFSTQHRDQFLSKWVPRPRTKRVFPPFSAAITVSTRTTDVRDQVAPGFLASLMCAGNDFQHQNNTALLSGPYASAGALSVVPANFERALVVHAVRRLPKATWLNDRDQFLAPAAEPLPADFVAGCVAWSLFSNSNQTAALAAVPYQGTTYSVPNHLYPWAKAEVRTWPLKDLDVQRTLTAADPDRHAAAWLLVHAAALPPAAQALLAAARPLYQFFYAHLPALRTGHFRIGTWDAGWFQVRNALADQNLAPDLLADVKRHHAALGQWLLPQLAPLGFLP